MDNTERIIKRISSPINDQLKIVMKGDKKLLNTKNTNYSYGTLVDVLLYGLDSIPTYTADSVLLLGMGGGSIIPPLREKYNYHGPIDAVELDPIVIDLAKEEFNIEADKKVTIIEADAWNYVENCKKQYSLIIVDIFIDIHVPKKFYNPEFWLMVKKITKENGFIVFNAGIDMKEDDVKSFVESLPLKFVYQKNYDVLESNIVIIMQKMG